MSAATNAPSETIEAKIELPESRGELSSASHLWAGRRALAEGKFFVVDPMI